MLRHYSRDKAPLGAFRLPTGLRVPPQGCALLIACGASHKYGSMLRDYLEVRLERNVRHFASVLWHKPLALAHLTFK